MIKVYLLTKSKFKEVKPWLEKNISQEGVRWWVDSDFISPDTGGKVINKLSVELTEEEEPMLTWLGLQL